MPSKFQEMLKVQRENNETSRAGLKWDFDEDDKMLFMVRNGDSHEVVAKVLQRTVGSIGTRLIINAINKMNNENMSLADAAKYACVSDTDVTEYLNKKTQRDNKKQTIVQRRKDTPSINSLQESIYSIHRRLEVLEKGMRR